MAEITGFPTQKCLDLLDRADGDLSRALEMAFEAPDNDVDAAVEPPTGAQLTIVAATWHSVFNRDFHVFRACHPLQSFLRRRKPCRRKRRFTGGR